MPTNKELRLRFENARLALLRAGSPKSASAAKQRALELAANEYAVARMLLETEGDLKCCKKEKPRKDCGCRECPDHGLNLSDAPAHYGLYHDQENDEEE